MNKNGPIIIIEDDEDDQGFLAEVFKKLNFENEILFFSDGELALVYLNSTKQKPFIIFSDINMPKIDGFELRDKIRTIEKLEVKCIPYLFLSSASTPKIVIDAYSKAVQGFFVKPDNMRELENMVKSIVQYWQYCEAPNFPE